MPVILSRAKYKFMTSSDTSEFVKSESYYIIIIILTDRNENAFDPTSAYISQTLKLWLDNLYNRLIKVASNQTALGRQPTFSNILVHLVY